MNLMKVVRRTYPRREATTQTEEGEEPAGINAADDSSRKTTEQVQPYISKGAIGKQTKPVHDSCGKTMISNAK